MLGKARVEVSAQVAGAAYQVKLVLPDGALAVSGVTREELLELADGLRKLAEGETPLERWDGQSGG
ncbi:hypothetical protein ABS71_17525 [bacterium SCN 62-11]|nr:MAG: hypothetical protein ABS71_17525 [bacterium SCN 62-11]